MDPVLVPLLVASAASGIVPLVNAELLVVAAAAALADGGLPAVLLVGAVAAAGQMASKALLFLLARHAPRRLPARARARLERAVDAMEEREGAAGLTVLASASVGLPPFYLVSLAAGALGVRTRSFLAAGFAGRFARFAALAWAGGQAGGALGAGTAVMAAVGAGGL